MTTMSEAFNRAGINAEAFARPRERSGMAFCLSLGGKFNVQSWLVVEVDSGPDMMRVISERANRGNEFNLNYVTSRCKDYQEAKAQLTEKLEAWLDEGTEGHGKLYRFKLFDAVNA